MALGGGIPTELGALGSLNELHIAGKNLEEGIPTELGQRENLSKSKIL